MVKYSGESRRPQLPFAIFDLLRFSNRIAGPAYRLRHELSRLAAGDSVDPVIFRGDDFWQELADELNRLSARIEEQTQPFQGISRQIDTIDHELDESIVVADSRS